MRQRRWDVLVNRHIGYGSAGGEGVGNENKEEVLIHEWFVVCDYGFALRDQAYSSCL